MSPHDWHLTTDVNDFLACAEGFLHPRPALHTVPLSVTEALRTRGPDTYGVTAPTLGVLERAGEAGAAFFHTLPRRLTPTLLTRNEADTLAAHLAGLGYPLTGVNADHRTAALFTEAWQRYTGAVPTVHERERLYRLDALTPPQPLPQGRARIANAEDRDQLMVWHCEFITDIGGIPAEDNHAWADTRIAHGRITLWETPDGTPDSMAGRTPMVAGQIRVAPVYTPAHLRGRGYASAATVEVSRAALADGAREVLLFADMSNPTSNSLYQRIGYRPIADFAADDF
ncbi:GNAT family N-acetyltransferase [Streptomyces sp. NPDC050095]|uniref:GNAT family N-acetyltransferase n=1 Tax=unclassified Streptomyces TaxID=2593676 RepID=UPI003433AE6B